MNLIQLEVQLQREPFRPIFGAIVLTSSVKTASISYLNKLKPVDDAGIRSVAKQKRFPATFVQGV